MSVTANACPACSAPVPYGRLSCPACGELLAAVAGLPRRTAVPSTDSGPPGDVGAVGPAAEPEAEPSAALDPAPMALAAAETAASPEAGWSAAVEHVPTAPPADLVATDPDDHPAAFAAAAPAPSTIVLARADAEDDDVPLLDPEPEAYPVRPAAFVAASTAPATPAGAIAPPPASLDLAPAVVASFAGAMPITPSGVHTPGTPFAAAGALSTGGGSASRRSPSVPLPALRMGKLPEQLVVAGAGVAAVSFALPWGSAMIGAPSIGQPWITLGIMGSWHVLALLAVLGTAALAVRGTRFGPWLRIGVVPLLVCGDLLGLAWPYLTTSLGRGVGVYAVLVGAIAMGVGAVLALRAATHPIAIRPSERNAAPAPTV